MLSTQIAMTPNEIDTHQLTNKEKWTETYTNIKKGQVFFFFFTPLEKCQMGELLIKPGSHSSKRRTMEAKSQSISCLQSVQPTPQAVYLRKTMISSTHEEMFFF
jgi:alanine dehydrogenase